MNRSVRMILWVSLFIILLFSFSGFLARLGYESSNKSVIPVADYNEFQSAAVKAGVSSDNMMLQLKNSQILTAAVRYPVDYSLFPRLKVQGFDLMLILQNPEEHNQSYLYEVEKIIKEYRIKYVMFDGAEATGYPSHLDGMADIIKRYSLVVGVIEAPSQTGCVEQKGLDTLILKTNYSVNRVYITPSKDLVSMDSSSLFYRWLRCVVDRSIRFIFLTPLKNPDLSNIDNLNDPILASRDLTTFISSKVYTVNKPLSYLSPVLQNSLQLFSILLGLMLAAALYVLYLSAGGFKPLKPLIAVQAAIFISFLIIMHFFPAGLSQYLAFLASVIYPALSGLLVLSHLKNSPSKPLVFKLTACLFIYTGINLLGVYTISTALSNVHNILGLNVYTAVVPSYIIPLIIFTLNFLIYYIGPKNIKNYFKSNSLSRPCYGNILLLSGIILIFYIYVSRSGNNSLIPASKMELELRKLLEKLMLARPRFKEFLIAYPSLFLLVYMFDKNAKKILLFLLGMGAVIGSISILNSFCHVFTSVEISMLRTFNGLLLGIITGTLSTAAVYFISSWIKKWQLRAGKYK